VDPNQFRSKSRNCPFAGWRVHGRADLVVVGGVVNFERLSAEPAGRTASH
jgi:dihydroorotase